MKELSFVEATKELNSSTFQTRCWLGLEHRLGGDPERQRRARGEAPEQGSSRNAALGTGQFREGSLVFGVEV